MTKKVFVSGCFDMLHSGHIAFLEEAAGYGDLYVGIGSDQTVYNLKGKLPVYNQDERLYMVKALKFVKDAWINGGDGVLDFKEDIKKLSPDILFVNEDGDSGLKKKLCDDLGIVYKISKRVPHENLPGRSTTSLRKKNTIPYRIDLAGGWLDQPYVSKHYPGPVITVSIEPDHVFNERSGMSTSTRKKAMELWENKIPAGDKIKLAKILFCYENPPGSKYISGSQDSLGIVLPGINYLWYDKQQYWPSKIKNIIDAGTIKWLEQRLFLLPLPPRHNDLVVTDNSIINKKNAKALSTAADDLWNALLLKDDTAFGNAMTDSFNAQISLFPNMINADVRKAIDNLPDTVLGYKLSGAGGGGYLVLFMNEKLENTITVRVRR